MSSKTAPAAVGDVIAGRYRIDAWLGQGNMAVVFRATHLGTNQECALKLVLPHIVELPEVRELFLKEARVGARIGRNPHIVDVIDAGFDEARKVPYIAMELLEGETLDRYISNHGAGSPALVRTIFRQIADALEQAHAKGVVHRDLKPGNLFLTFDRKKQAHIKLVDFGIAKLTEQDVQKTATQIGTPAYAAPEQLGVQMRNIAAKQGVIIATTVGPSTDVWALGLIAFELLTGASPGHFWDTVARAELFDLLMGIALEPTPKATERAGDKAHTLPEGFDEWLEKCLRKNALVRWPSVKEAVEHLVMLLDEGYEDEATRQMDAARANALKLGLRAQKLSEPPRPSVPEENISPKISGTLPLVAVPEKPTKPAGPRGTAVMEVKRDAAGRPVALSRPDSLEESDEQEHQPRALPSAKASPQQRESSPALIAPARTSSTPTRPTPAPHSPVVFAPAQSAPTKRLSRRNILAVVSALAVLFGVLFVLLAPQKGALKIEAKTKVITAATPIEIFVDGKKYCDVLPCIVTDLSPGKHRVALSVNGTILEQTDATVEARKEIPVPFNDGPIAPKR